MRGEGRGQSVVTALTRGIAMSTIQPQHVRSPDLMAGGLAGASAALALMIFTALLFSVGGLWQFLFNSAIPVIGDSAWAGVLQDTRRLPSFLWGWRWIVLALLLIGVLLAWLDRIEARLPLLWRDRAGRAALMVASALFIVTLLLTSADSALYGGGGESESLPSLSARRSGVWNMVLVGGGLSFAAGGAVWLYWSWWYRIWRRWMRLDAPGGSGSQPSGDWFARREQAGRARRVFGMTLVAGILLVVAAVAGYEQVRTQVRSGELWVTPETPTSTAQLELNRPQRSLIAENIFGGGTVSFVVVDSRGVSVSAPVELTFSERISYQRTPLEIGDLPPGSYQLAVQLAAGDGGRVGYALVQGNELLAAAVAALVGLGVGVALASLVLLASTRVPLSGA
jgi:hypothetical protein